MKKINNKMNNKMNNKINNKMNNKKNNKLNNNNNKYIILEYYLVIIGAGNFYQKSNWINNRKYKMNGVWEVLRETRKVVQMK